MLTREELMKARIKNDSKRLIEKAMRKEPPQLDRNVKAWLKSGTQLPEIDKGAKSHENTVLMD